MINKKSLVILGNGPSLKEFDFSLLSNIDSIGMNAAYRYWERINIFPTHYICLDDQLIETHAKAIHDLIVTKKVKTAFLIAKFLDYYPDMIKQDNVYFLESFHGARQKRVANKGVPYIKSIPFQESDSSKVTTGAYAIRYAAHLGYNNITILGVDLRYVEIIPEAKKVEGIKLIIESTPKSNPNYFFDDYQRAGDKYNIPNPDTHNGNLHVSAFEVLANDIVQYGWDAKVFNSNEKSILNDKGVFPFISIEIFAQKKGLSAIVVPTTPREIAQILINFKAWDQPRMVPYIGKVYDGMPKIIFVFSCQDDAKLRNKVLEAYNNTRYVKKIFSKCQVMFIGLDDKVDYYERDYTKSITGKGYKSGPNEQFFETINLLNGIGDFIFYMETDCVPIRQGWLNHIMDLALGDFESWVIGSLYRGIDKISDNFFMHINGNALYKVGSQDFIDFVNEYWRVNLYDVIENKDKRIAYDCLLSYLFTEAKPSESNQSWIKYQEVAHRFRNSSFIQNISGNADKSTNTIKTIKTIKDIIINHNDTFLVHGAPFIKLLTDKINKQIKCNKSRDNFSWADYFDVNQQTVIQNKYPKILMVDGTPVGHNSATGQLKQVFLANWPESSFLQVWQSFDGHPKSHIFQIGQTIKDSQSLSLGKKVLSEKFRSFSPDIIYFRPTDSADLFDIVEQTIAVTKKPLVIHMMDDWPERLRLEDKNKYNQLNTRLQKLIEYADGHLSISKKMADIYNIRYGFNWTPLANGVDVNDFQRGTKGNKKHHTKSKPFIIRYMGALADDMTFTSVSDVAQIISSMHSKYSVCLEIYTMSWCKSKAEKKLGALSGVSIHGLVNANDYIKYLCEADTLLIAYNFDQKSINYTSLSLANKMPECLASGVPLLAYGPSSIATIDFLEQSNCAQVVNRRETSLLKKSIKQLIIEPKYCQILTKKARKFVLNNLSKQKVQQEFYNMILETKNRTPVNSIPLIGPFDRSSAAHYDETDCVAQLYLNSLTGSTMIDVGAHHGWALLPFLKQDWDIYAFEPDNKNRTKLLEQLAKHKNKSRVSIDTRCVSNKEQKNISFYSSEQSTGISGLSAFHETHTEAQKVDTTTLSDFFENKPLSKVDFLKIDTEGHDLFVLQGFPWGRVKPAVIECEYEDSKTIPLGYTFHDLAKYLFEKGYKVYVSEWHPIIRYGIRHDWKQLTKYPCQLSNEQSWGNLLAFRDEINEQDLILTIQKILKINEKQCKEPKVNKVEGSLNGIRFSRLHETPSFTKISNTHWNYNHTSIKQRLWIAIFEVGSTKGCSFTASIKLKSSKEITASISFGRQGKTEYEGKNKQIKLMPNITKNIRINNVFFKSHSELKIQVDILQCEGNRGSDFEITSFFVVESMSNFEGNKVPTLFETNRLFRENYYSTAMSYYLLMGREQSLSIYFNNALMAAKKLGIEGITSEKELLDYINSQS